MFQSIQFRNFKALRDASLPLQPFTLILGPNGSGKSTALQALLAMQDIHRFHFADVASVGASDIKNVSVTVAWAAPFNECITVLSWDEANRKDLRYLDATTRRDLEVEKRQALARILSNVQVYAFDNDSIVAPVVLEQQATLGPKGNKLAVVLDRLRDQSPERFQAINTELRQWLPEFDTILFDTPQQGFRSINLRTKHSGAAIQAKDLSQGTLQALAILTIAYLPNPPRIIGIEEPDRGIHPRLLRQVRDALYRLAYPKEFGENRIPTQVIATTHSPYFLDLYRDRPEEVVLAEKLEEGAQFIPLSNYAHLEEILKDTQLGEAWYTGILGGVPANS